jgi:hypothetical protein
MFLSLLAGLAVSPHRYDFYSEGPYDSSIPRPESILRYGPGERTTTFREQEQVLQAIVSKAPTRIQSIEYGRSEEGRPLRIYVIGSPQNLAHLDEIRRRHRQLAVGQGSPDSTIPIVWINECIHGDETASFESAMWTAYNLVASRNRTITDALSKVLVVLNPVYNPDGHERYAVYYNSVATGSDDPRSFEFTEPRTVFGRLNHYRFDMNRDRVAFSQKETRAEFAEMLRWCPQVYIDQHGQVGSYFFPPEPMSINQNVDRGRNSKWTEIFGRATAKAFDRHGFSYFVKDTFDLYYPGYIDSSNTLSGAIGMTHETDGGRVLAASRDDGSKVTLRQGMAKHCVSAMAVVEAAADHDRELLSSYADFKKRVVTGDAAGNFKRVVLASPDPRPLQRLKEQLGYAGIQANFAKQPFTQADATDYWTGKKAPHAFPAGSLVIDMAQSQGALAKALLEPGQNFEPEFIQAQVGKKKTAAEGETYPGPDNAEFYDVTGWSLPFASDLAAWWCESAPGVKTEAQPDRPNLKRTESSVGYAIPYTDQEDILAVCEACDKGAKAVVTTKPMVLAGQTFERGTFLFLADHNDDGYEDTIYKAAQNHGATVIPLSTEYPDSGYRTGPGSESVDLFHQPNVGVVFGKNGNIGEVGAIWYLMDRVFHLPFTPLKTEALSDELSSFTTIVVPGGVGASDGSVLRSWVARGGNLVVLGDPSWAIGSGSFVSLDQPKGPLQDLPGALFRASIDPRSVLSDGYERGEGGSVPIAVPIGGGAIYQTRKEGGSFVTLPSDEKVNKLLSGWEWPDETEKALQGAVFTQDVPIGRGHVIVFTQDPTERAMWPGLNKLLLNAMLLGG